MYLLMLLNSDYYYYYGSTRRMQPEWVMNRSAMRLTVN